MFGATGSFHVIATSLLRVIIVEFFLDSWADDKLRLKNFIEINSYNYLASGIWSFEDFRLTAFVKTPIFFLLNMKLVFVRDKVFQQDFDSNELISVLAMMALMIVGSYIRNLDVT